VQWPRVEGGLPLFAHELVPVASFAEDRVFELRAPSGEALPPLIGP
jgi:hypothetical protein